ncbi:hypothetical protein C8R43DRAFT_966208, partial [Mycena crocata]
LTPFNGIIINIPAEPTYPRPNFLPSAQEFELVARIARSSCALRLVHSNRTIIGLAARERVRVSGRDTALRVDGRSSEVPRAGLIPSAGRFNIQPASNSKRIFHERTLEIVQITPNLRRRYGGNTGFETRLEFYSFDKIPAAMPPSCIRLMIRCLAVEPRSDPRRLQTPIGSGSNFTSREASINRTRGLATAANAVASRAGYGERPPPPERIRACAELESESGKRNVRARGEGASTRSTRSTRRFHVARSERGGALRVRVLVDLTWMYYVRWVREVNVRVRVMTKIYFMTTIHSIELPFRFQDVRYPPRIIYPVKVKDPLGRTNWQESLSLFTVGPPRYSRYADVDSVYRIRNPVFKCFHICPTSVITSALNQVPQEWTRWR